jgi:hypothetical protein
MDSSCHLRDRASNARRWPIPYETATPFLAAPSSCVVANVCQPRLESSTLDHGFDRQARQVRKYEKPGPIVRKSPNLDARVERRCGAGVSPAITSRDGRTTI